MNCCMKGDSDFPDVCEKIPRPPNAFMLYANENRKAMAQMHPTESNKEISKRLGNSWKALEVEEKSKYFDKAKSIDIEHKKRYPNYVYNPKEARIRKAMRDANRGGSPMVPRPSARRPSLWITPHEEQLMMSPMSNMRATVGNSMCNFSMPPPGVSHTHGQYMNLMGAYNKIDQQMPPSTIQPEYLQETPLSQLQQQQHNMWHPFSDPEAVRSCSAGTSLMVADEKPKAYPSNIIHTKETSSSPIVSTNISNQHYQQQHQEDNIIDNAIEEANMRSSSSAILSPPTDQMQHSNGTEMAHTDSRENDIAQSQPREKDTIYSSPAYTENIPSDLLDKRDNSKKTLKDEGGIHTEGIYLPLSCQTLMVPQELLNNDSSYHRHYIINHFDKLQDYELFHVTGLDNQSFPYVTVNTQPPCCRYSASCCQNSFKPMSNYIMPTDIGYLPVFDVEAQCRETTAVLNMTMPMK